MPMPSWQERDGCGGANVALNLILHRYRNTGDLDLLMTYHEFGQCNIRI